MYRNRLHVRLPANRNAVADDAPASSQSSQTSMRATGLASRDIFAPLPDSVLVELHERMDLREQGALFALPPPLVQVKEHLTRRLFPTADQRRHVVHLRLHSHATAIAAAEVAEKARLRRYTAFLCGYLHDIGIASAIRHIDDFTSLASELDFETAWPTILSAAENHARCLSLRWRLPSTMRYAIRDHVGFVTTDNPHLMACVTFVGEHLASVLGCGFRDEQPPSGLRKALSALGLTERDLSPLSRRIEQRLGEVEIDWESLRFLREG